MLIVSLATPHAFGVDGVVFGVAYFIVRALHLVLYAIAGRGDPELLRAVLRIAAERHPRRRPCSWSPDSSTAPPQMAVWAVALAIDYLWLLVVGMRGWRVSPEHFVERHGLVIIIALGESIVAIGVGAAGLPLDAGEITAALLGIVVASALWWSYFDWAVYIAQARLADATGAERAALARDLYSYLHLPMVAGIVLFALGHEDDARPCRRAARDHPGRRPVRRPGAVLRCARRAAPADRRRTGATVGRSPRSSCSR